MAVCLPTLAHPQRRRVNGVCFGLFSSPERPDMWLSLLSTSSHAPSGGGHPIAGKDFSTAPESRSSCLRRSRLCRFFHLLKPVVHFENGKYVGVTSLHLSNGYRIKISNAPERNVLLHILHEWSRVEYEYGITKRLFGYIYRD